MGGRGGDFHSDARWDHGCGWRGGGGSTAMPGGIMDVGGGGGGSTAMPERWDHG